MRERKKEEGKEKNTGEKKPAQRAGFSENNLKIILPEQRQPALHQQQERPEQRQPALRQQQERPERRQPAWRRQQQERQQVQRQELQRQEPVQVPELLPSCRKQPGQQPAGKRSTESFS
jgi:hypothetical protein